MSRMYELAGIKQEVITEGWMQNLAVAVGLLAGTANAGAQELSYPPKQMDKIETALNNPDIQAKLRMMGVEDNNIEKAKARFKKIEPKRFLKKTAHNDQELAKLLKRGFHLTAIEAKELIDTIYTAPIQTETKTSTYSIGDDKFFASGAYKLNSAETIKIKSVLDSIAQSGDVLIGVNIISSTDGQRVRSVKNGGTLALDLRKMGLPENNIGLAKARINDIRNILQNFEISSDIISETPHSLETGDINPKDRYVLVDFTTMHVEPGKVMPGEQSIKISYPITYKLMKAFPKAEHRPKHSPVRVRKCKSPNRKGNRGYECQFQTKGK